MTADDLAALNEQIAAMARAGLPLDQGMASLARDMGRGPLRTVTAQLADDLRAGHPLPEAMARQEGRLPPYYATLVTAGVRTGRLPEVLTTLTTYARTVAATRALVIEALFYPAVVLVLGVAIFTALAWYVLPQFDEVFTEFGLKLPDITQAVLMLGRHPVELIVLPIATLVALVVALWTWGRVSRRGRQFMARAVYCVPLIGRLVRSARLAAFTELLATLVEHGTPLPSAFRLAGAASSDPDLADRAARVEERLNLGEPLAKAFRDRGFVPGWVTWLAAAGERQNALAATLREIAAIHRRQVDGRSAVLRTVLPPLIVILSAGVLTVFFVASVMSPMIKLLEGLSK